VKFLIFGKNGWLGGILQRILTERKIDFALANTRLENRESVAAELDSVKPTHVLNAAGVTGRPNVDWCEDHQPEVIRANVIGTLNLADLCDLRGIHCMIYATGCIFHFDKNINRPYPVWQPETKTWSKLEDDQKFTEDDAPNFTGSFYSLTKGYVETMLKSFKNVCVLRVRMPISDDLTARNFITKITKYEKVVNIPNSMTVLSDLMPISVIMAERKLTGIYNFTNPGCISHNQILELYKQYIDPTFEYKNFNLDEQAKVIKAERSNNELCSKKFVSALPDIEILDIHTAMHGVFKRMKENLLKEGDLPCQKKQKVSN